MTEQERKAVDDFLRERGALQIPRGLSGEYDSMSRQRFLKMVRGAPRTLRGKEKEKVLSELLTGIPRKRYGNV